VTTSETSAREGVRSEGVRSEGVPSEGGRRFPLAVWMAIAIAVALSAGALYWTPARAGRSGPAGPGMTAQQVAAEYRSEAQSLELAPGWQWPVDVTPRAQGPDGSPMLYQAGYGVGHADLYWFYTWASTAVSSREPAAARAAALRQLPHVYSTALFTRGLITDPSYYRQMIDAALKGDTTRLQEFVRANRPAKQ